MKFCDKLPKLRKDNNLSQEVLADKLGVSRQAVSKWESGSSYPDMEKMIEICKILNCTLEDLLDDGAVGKGSSNNKFSFSDYVHDFLKFVTKTCNMFWAMSFKGKIKCLIELAFIGLILLLIGMIIGAVFSNLFGSLIMSIPKIGFQLYNIFASIVYVALFISGFIIFVHIFKIRYLDYYVTIEDNNQDKKEFEKPIDDDTEKGKGSKREKIIIRDPKHSKFSFFDCLANIVVVIFKFLVFALLVPCIIIFLGLIALFVFSLCKVSVGIIAVYFAISVLGVSLLGYVIIELVLKFLASKRQSLKRLFLMTISGFIIFGIGIGLTASEYSTFNYTEDLPAKYKSGNSVNISMDNNIVLDGYNMHYKIDNNEKNIKFKSKYSFLKLGIDKYYGDKYMYDTVYNYLLPNEFLELFLNDVKGKNTRNYDDLISDKITVYVNKENYKKLINNHRDSLKMTDVIEE